MPENDKKTKRLFIGTFIDRQIFAPIYSEIQKDFNKVISGKWVEQENLHFTYKFLGAVEETEIPQIEELLSDYLRTYDSVFEFNRLGVFPNIKEPRVLWLGLFNPDRVVFDISSGIDEKMKSIGFKPERRKFLPHVTLIRIKKSLNTGFVDILKDYNRIDLPPMTSFSVNLIESKLTSEGPIYTIIK
jgi:RNA 2',3'-cyclic 3'-phosphodiesterase